VILVAADAMITVRLGSRTPGPAAHGDLRPRTRPDATQAPQDHRAARVPAGPPPVPQVSADPEVVREEERASGGEPEPRGQRGDGAPGVEHDRGGGRVLAGLRRSESLQR
jgi:hypothetical protein